VSCFVLYSILHIFLSDPTTTEGNGRVEGRTRKTSIRKIHHGCSDVLEDEQNGADDIVEINVGGKVFLQVLRAARCALLPARCSLLCLAGVIGKTHSLIRDDEGRIFLDHDPELVKVIVNFLRIRKIEEGRQR